MYEKQRSTGSRDTNTDQQNAGWDGAVTPPAFEPNSVIMIYYLIYLLSTGN
jgi:hypothetical protein